MCKFIQNRLSLSNDRVSDDIHSIMLIFIFSGETCKTSSDCNVSKGLCCKLTRRARSQPKKVMPLLPMFNIGVSLNKSF